MVQLVFFKNIIIYLWLFDRESMWGFLVLIGKRKVLIGGCKEEGKKRNIWCSRAI